MAGFLAALQVLTRTNLWPRNDGWAMKGYVAVVFGGLYSIPGAILGALMIGVENLAGGYPGHTSRPQQSHDRLASRLPSTGLFGIRNVGKFRLWKFNHPNLMSSNLSWTEVWPERPEKAAKLGE